MWGMVLNKSAAYADDKVGRTRAESLGINYLIYINIEYMEQA
jgi:hypothetical protein